MASQDQNKKLDEKFSSSPEPLCEAMETDETDTKSETNEEDVGESVNKSEAVGDISEAMDTQDTVPPTDDTQRINKEHEKEVASKGDSGQHTDETEKVVETEKSPAKIDVSDNREDVEDLSTQVAVSDSSEKIQELSTGTDVSNNSEVLKQNVDELTGMTVVSNQQLLESSAADKIESQSVGKYVNSGAETNDIYDRKNTEESVESCATETDTNKLETDTQALETDMQTESVRGIERTEKSTVLPVEAHVTKVIENAEGFKTDLTKEDTHGSVETKAEPIKETESITITTKEAENDNVPLKSNQSDTIAELSSADPAKATINCTETLEDAKSLVSINGGINSEKDIFNVSSRATFGDSSYDNMSMSGVSESKSGGFESSSFPVEKIETDESDMNLLKEERLELYLKSMRNVNQVGETTNEPKIDAANSTQEMSVDNEVHVEVDNKQKESDELCDLVPNSKDTEHVESSKSENKEGTQNATSDLVKHTNESLFPEPSKRVQNSSSDGEGTPIDEGLVSSDRSTESSNGEKSQTDMEVANIMKKGLREEEIDTVSLPVKDPVLTEQNEDTKIPDVEVDPQNEKDIWKADDTKSVEKHEKAKTDNGKDIDMDIEKQGQESSDRSEEVIETKEKGSKVDIDPEDRYTAKETESAFIKLPVSNKVKKDSEQPREILKRKMFEEFTEDSSNSSWYIIKDKPTEEPMDTDDKNRGLLITDEGSNLSVPDDSSLASAGAMEDSRLSFTDQVSNMDETSNLSAGDSCSVKAFGHELVLDESANLNPPDKDLFVQPSTPSSVVTDATSEATPVKRYRRGTLAIAVEEASEHGHNIKAKDLFEYQWPQESGGDWFMLQEQISTYLEVKSFKRKYPDLFRRVCDKMEKDFLREKGVVSETQSDLGLTALKSEEVHELISKDYPSKYREYCTVLHEKEKEIMVNKQKDYSLPKLEKSKMREYTMKAMKSTSEWNRQFLKERNEERRAYFDMQTFAIHYPKSKYRKVENIKTMPTAYPVSLIPGQFQEYCRKYSAEELKYFPLNTAMFSPPKKMNNSDKEPEQESESHEEEAPKNGSVSESGEESSSDSGESDEEEKGKESEKEKDKSISREPSAEKMPEPVAVKDNTLPLCHVCSDEEKQDKQKSRRKNSKTDEELIQCSECKKSGHPSCLDLTDAMLKIVKTYPWQCMECKTCVECMDPYDEDKMLFCDQCDRGYHTFCVGLKSLPTGKWECVSCRGDSAPIKPLPKPPVRANIEHRTWKKTQRSQC